MQFGVGVRLVHFRLGQEALQRHSQGAFHLLALSINLVNTQKVKHVWQGFGRGSTPCTVSGTAAIVTCSKGHSSLLCRVLVCVQGPVQSLHQGNSQWLTQSARWCVGVCSGGGAEPASRPSTAQLMLRAALRQQLRASTVPERLEHLMDAPPSWVHKLHITRDMLERSGQLACAPCGPCTHACCTRSFGQAREKEGLAHITA